MLDLCNKLRLRNTYQLKSTTNTNRNRPVLKKTLLRALVIMAILVSVILLTLFVNSPQETAPFTDNNGEVIDQSVAEILDIEIGGVQQRILLRGKDISNPILLHLHGGPGSPDHTFIKAAQADLEDMFTVCYWDERGAGASYSEDIPKASMTVAQLVNDGLVLTTYLTQRFGKEKIYLQAHSWGTALGAHMIKQSPDLFHAYIGIGQMTHAKRSEQLSYDFTLAEAQKAGDEEGVNKLKAIGRPPYQTDKEWLSNLWVERNLMIKYQKPEDKEPKSMLDIYMAFVTYPEYSIQDKLNALSGDPFSMNALWMQVLDLNLFNTHHTFEVPVYFLQGKHDQTTVTSLVKLYYDSIDAPTKRYIEFEQSAHAPYLEETERYKNVVKSILTEQNL